jgi:hypothetical protein
MKCPKCEHEFEANVKPVVYNVHFVDDGPRLRAVGFINNREFIFFTDDDRREWWFEMSLDPFTTVNNCNKGDGIYFSVENKYNPQEAGRAMDQVTVNHIIKAIVKNLVLSGQLDKYNFDAFADRLESEGFEPTE